MLAINSTCSSSKVMQANPKRAKVTHQHTLDRVRDNQRRHRERRRDHIVTLEAKLGESENNIRILQEQLLFLKKKLGQCQCGNKNLFQDESTKILLDGADFIQPFPSVGALITAPLVTTPIRPIWPEDPIENEIPNFMENIHTSISGEPTPCLNACPSRAKPTSNSSYSFQLRNDPCFNLHILDRSISSISLSPSLVPAAYNQVIGVPLLCDQFSNTDPPPSNLLQDPSGEHNISKHISSSKSTTQKNGYESTILCRQAYQIIFTQNLKDLSHNEVENWLSSGFRWPKTDKSTHLNAVEQWADGSWSEENDGKTEGCRVETTLLYGLLSFISEV